MAVSQYKEQLPEEVLKRIGQKEDVELLDVREPEEWEAGHIPGAKHIPLGEIPDRIHELNPNKETIVICRSGNRSGKACDFLSARGHQVVNMAGGMMKWNGEVKRGK